MSVFVWPVVVLWLAWLVVYYGAPSGKHSKRSVGIHFRRKPKVRDELLIRSMDACPKCQAEMYVFNDACGSCGHVRYAPDASTLRMPVTHHRRPELVGS